MSEERGLRFDREIGAWSGKSKQVARADLTRRGPRRGAGAKWTGQPSVAGRFVPSAGHLSDPDVTAIHNPEVYDTR